MGAGARASRPLRDREHARRPRSRRLHDRGSRGKRARSCARGHCGARRRRRRARARSCRDAPARASRAAASGVAARRGPSQLGRAVDARRAARRSPRAGRVAGRRGARRRACRRHRRGRVPFATARRGDAPREGASSGRLVARLDGTELTGTTAPGGTTTYALDVPAAEHQIVVSLDGETVFASWVSIAGRPRHSPRAVVPSASATMAHARRPPSAACRPTAQAE